jgi:8-hydroxy-5-deazaflavin:NADPH oxidoreductase
VLAGWLARWAPSLHRLGTTSPWARAIPKPRLLWPRRWEAERCTVTSPAHARFGEVVLLAVNRSGITEALAAAGDLRGKPLIDSNNPGSDPARGLLIAERIRKESGASVVKAFNCCHFHVWRMSPPAFDGRRLAVPYCGDDKVAKARVRTLIEQMGCTPLDLGGLGKARHIEYLAAIVIGLLFDGADPSTVFNLVDATT